MYSPQKVAQIVLVCYMFHKPYLCCTDHCSQTTDNFYAIKQKWETPQLNSILFCHLKNETEYKQPPETRKPSQNQSWILSSHYKPFPSRYIFAIPQLQQWSETVQNMEQFIDSPKLIQYLGKKTIMKII